MSHFAKFCIKNIKDNLDRNKLQYTIGLAIVMCGFFIGMYPPLEKIGLNILVISLATMMFLLAFR